jgi:hypothetical protein
MWRDWVLVGLLLPVVVLEGIFRPDLPWRAVSATLAVVLLPVLLWRRTRPLLTVAIAFGASAIASLFTGGVPPEIYAMVYLLLLPYSLYRWGSGREVVVGSAIMFVKVALTAAFGGMTVTDALGNGVTTAATAPDTSSMSCPGVGRVRGDSC